MGEDTSPLSIWRGLSLLLRSVVGIAESRARVYGCCGARKSSSFGACSTTSPIYMTIISSLICRTTQRSCVMNI